MSERSKSVPKQPGASSAVHAQAASTRTWNCKWPRQWLRGLSLGFWPEVESIHDPVGKIPGEPDVVEDVDDLVRKCLLREQTVGTPWHPALPEQS